MTNCEFTRDDEEPSNIICKNKEVQVNVCNVPMRTGHIVVEPKNNACDIAELNKKEWSTLLEWLPKVSKAMKKVITDVLKRTVEKIYIFSFNESKDFPVHFHLIPVFKEDTKRGFALLRLLQCDKSDVDPEKIEIIREKMKVELQCDK